MSKITFIGAGSTVFAKNILGDCLFVPPLQALNLHYMISTTTG